MNKQLNLSDETIIKIYNDAKAGKQTQIEIGAKYGISNTTVSRIKRLRIEGYIEKRDHKLVAPERLRTSDKSTGKCCAKCMIYFEDQAPGHPRVCWYCASRTNIKNIVNDMTDSKNVGQSPHSDRGCMVLGNY